MKMDKISHSLYILSGFLKASLRFEYKLCINDVPNSLELSPICRSLEESISVLGGNALLFPMFLQFSSVYISLRKIRLNSQVFYVASLSVYKLPRLLLERTFFTSLPQSLLISFELVTLDL